MGIYNVICYNRRAFISSKMISAFDEEQAKSIAEPQYLAVEGVTFEVHELGMTNETEPRLVLQSFERY